MALPPVDCGDLLAEWVNTGPYFDIEAHTWQMFAPGTSLARNPCLSSVAHCSRCLLPASALSFPRIPTPLLSLPPSLFLLFLRSPLPVMILAQCDIIALSSNLPAADLLSEARRKFVDRGAQRAVRSVPRSREKTTYAKPSVSSLSVADCGDPACSRSGLALFVKSTSFPFSPPFKSLRTKLSI